MPDDAVPASESAPAPLAPPVPEPAPLEPVVVEPAPATEIAPLSEPLLPVETPGASSAPDATAEPVEVAPQAAPEPPAPEPTQQRTPESSTQAHAPSSLANARSAAGRAKAREHQKARIESDLAKLLESARGREFITNDIVQKLLRVSNATAVRYLSALVLRGKLMREGRGRGVKYKIVS